MSHVFTLTGIKEHCSRYKSCCSPSDGTFLCHLCLHSSEWVFLASVEPLAVSVRMQAMLSPWRQSICYFGRTEAHLPNVHINALCCLHSLSLCVQLFSAYRRFVYFILVALTPFSAHHLLCLHLSVMVRPRNAFSFWWPMVTASRCLLIHSFISCLTTLDYSKINIYIAQVAFSYMSHSTLFAETHSASVHCLGSSLIIGGIIYKSNRIVLLFASFHSFTAASRWQFASDAVHDHKDSSLVLFSMALCLSRLPSLGARQYIRHTYTHCSININASRVYRPTSEHGTSKTGPRQFVCKQQSTFVAFLLAISIFPLFKLFTSNR